MTPKDIVLEQIDHRETDPIPFTLGFEDGVDERLDEYYGTTAWRDKMPAYIVNVTTIDPDRPSPVEKVRIEL